MGCGESKTKAGGAALIEDTEEKTKSEGLVEEGMEPAREALSLAAQIANASPPKSAMKKGTERSQTEPVSTARQANPKGFADGREREGNTDSASPEHTGDDEYEGDRSFVKEDLANSFRNSSFVSGKGDCRVEKGVMAPTTSLIPSSSSDKSSSRALSNRTLLSPHSSDSDLLLVCIDCGCEINEKSLGQLCPLTARLHA